MIGYTGQNSNQNDPSCPYIPTWTWAEKAPVVNGVSPMLHGSRIIKVHGTDTC